MDRDKIDRLRALLELHREGGLTKAEFEDQKALLLRSTTAPEPTRTAAQPVADIKPRAASTGVDMAQPNHSATTSFPDDDEAEYRRSRMATKRNQKAALAATVACGALLLIGGMVYSDRQAAQARVERAERARVAAESKANTEAEQRRRQAEAHAQEIEAEKGKRRRAATPPPQRSPIPYVDDYDPWDCEWAETDLGSAELFEYCEAIGGLDCGADCPASLEVIRP